MLSYLKAIQELWSRLKIMTFIIKYCILKCYKVKLFYFTKTLLPKCWFYCVDVKKKKKKERHKSRDRSVVPVGSSGCMHVIQVVRKETSNKVLTIRTWLRKWFSLITIWFSNQITPFSLTNDIPQVPDTGNTLINLTLSKILLPLQSNIFPFFFSKKKKP